MLKHNSLKVSKYLKGNAITKMINILYGQIIIGTHYEVSIL